ncbi:Hypothetical_protein [Hexamita inflata]|uniref:Hypothetical_protein n=1 Tax=Hexamita inflata TaxID=28002 RepID=A0AA86NX91_9EUKA|nr:Hypothetical protein HINF_LOCUS14663 [Hexamita inflata]
MLNCGHNQLYDHTYTTYSNTICKHHNSRLLLVQNTIDNFFEQLCWFQQVIQNELQQSSTIWEHCIVLVSSRKKFYVTQLSYEVHMPTKCRNLLFHILLQDVAT